MCVPSPPVHVPPVHSIAQENTMQPPSASPCNLKRCAAIVNPLAANGLAAQLWRESLAQHVKDRLAQAGWQLEECSSTGPGGTRAAAAQACEAGVGVLLVVGGDGTVHEVVSGLMAARQQHGEQRQPALVMLPLGTGSDYARTFGWRPGDVEGACCRITSGRQQLADISRVEVLSGAPQGDSRGAAVHFVINVGSCAVGGPACARAVQLKRLGLGRLSYPLGAAIELLKWRGCSLEVCLDDSGVWRALERVTALVLGHGQFWGGGLRVLPDADPCDGLMEVLVLQGLGLWDFITKGHLLRSGRHLGVRGVTSLGGCKRLRVRTAGAAQGRDDKDPSPLVAWELDGEPHLPGWGLVDVRVLPGELRLLV